MGKNIFFIIVIILVIQIIELQAITQMEYKVGALLVGVEVVL
jgi:hypothetical protein